MFIKQSRTRQADEGFTLIELLISITILGLIAFPLANTVIGILDNIDSSSARMAGSHSAQISATYFAQDVQTVGIRDYTAANAPTMTSVLRSGDSGPTCGPGGGTALVRFLSDTYDTSVPAGRHSTVVSWTVVSASGDNQLVRARCIDGSQVAQITIARNLFGAPTVVCSSTCNGTTIPQTVTLSFTVQPPKAAAYAVSLTGDRRQT
jgi:prepilin-type N-terminal cleavage/methylation domain-containing protein